MENGTKHQKEFFQKVKLIDLLKQKRLWYPKIYASILVFSLALFLRIWRLSSAPGIYVDEPIYVEIAANLPIQGGIYLSGIPWFVHPPLFFILQSQFFQALGINAVSFSNILAARIPTCIISSLTVLIVFLWISKISNIMIGGLASLLLMLEQYSLNFGRVGIMESTVIFFIVASLYSLWSAVQTHDLKRYILGGVLFGLALLTKELAIYVLIILLFWVILSRYAKIKLNIEGIVTFAFIGLVIYVIYFDYQLYVYGVNFLMAKITSLENLFSTYFIGSNSIQSSTYNTLVYDITRTVSIYFVSLVLMVIGVCTSFYIILRKKSYSALFLVSWFLGSAVFRLLIGIENVKFFFHSVTIF